MQVVANICTNQGCRWSEESDHDVAICPECGSPTVIAYHTGYDDDPWDEREASE